MQKLQKYIRKKIEVEMNKIKEAINNMQLEDEIVE